METSKKKKTPTPTLEDAKATGQHVFQAYTDACMGAATRMDELAKAQLQAMTSLREQTVAAVSQTASAVLEANATARKAGMELVGSYA